MDPSPGPRTRAERWLRGFFVTVIVVGLAIIGVRIGQELLGPGPLQGLDNDVQQLQTTSGLYIGRLAGERGGFLVLEAPATVTTISAEGDAVGEEFLVQVLASDPYGVDGSLLIGADHVIMVADVRPDSQLAGAYRQASGQRPESTPEP